ncbi:hypothetical protein ACELLULO517_07465 [Acidisoma cellulosilytica]|uniref:Uncharacterized protein n=1 Tax=Acidisoma cellulosilyticum TaxID=2802395 RepID=A0A964E3L6_9PROT|nr:hypothetical protein [Acidisoma cellulosilyticum]MCB8880068.1 hypothetical protein [Acidisoma cellulosilyticum]
MSDAQALADCRKKALTLAGERNQYEAAAKRWREQSDAAHELLHAQYALARRQEDELREMVGEIERLSVQLALAQSALTPSEDK